MTYPPEVWFSRDFGWRGGVGGEGVWSAAINLFIFLPTFLKSKQ